MGILILIRGAHFMQQKWYMVDFYDYDYEWDS